MKQQIIFAPKISGTDYLKSLALLDNKNTFGVRVMNTLELARYMLEVSGYQDDHEFVNDTYLAAIIYKDVKKIDYFKNYTYKDIRDLINSVNELRKCIPDEEEKSIMDKLPTDLFVNKNDAVKAFYQLLKKTFEDNHLIDEIGIIRLAMEKYNSPINADFIRYEEFTLTNLDIALLNKAAGKEVTPVSVDNKEPLHIATYLKSFGQNNEIEWILKYIYDHNIKFDECLIVATDVSGYGKILSNYQAAIGFPLIIGSSQSINDTAPGRLFSLIKEWESNHFHKDYLVKLLNSRDFDLDKFKKDAQIPDNFDDFTLNDALPYFERLSFDKIIETVGNLEIGFDIKKNDKRFSDYKELVSVNPGNDPTMQRDLEISKYVMSIKGIIEQGELALLKNYVVLDEKNLAVEKDALSKIELGLSFVLDYGVAYLEMLKYLSSVAVGNRQPKPGYLYLTSISSAISYLRKYIFIVGLDSKNFPGKCAEDPIIFDRDYEKFGIENASFRKMEENKNDYHALIKFAKTMGCEIHLSYSYYNSQTTKEQSASSVFFETYRDEKAPEVVTIANLNNEFKNNKDKFISVEFFENNLFPLSKIGAAIKENIVIVSKKDTEELELPEEVEAPEEEIKTAEEEVEDLGITKLLGFKGLSASAIKDYLECEYKYLLHNLLHMEQEKDTNIYELIPANDLGTILHAMMEEFTLKSDKQQFIDEGEKKIREYFITHPSDNKQGIEKEVNEFKRMLSNAFDMEMKSGLEGVLREQDLVTTHIPTGLRIHGLPDKVEQFSNGDFRVVDFKTGKKIAHDVNDKDSMIQGALYAYIVMNGKNKLNNYGKKKINVSEFVFRYPRMERTVSSLDDDHTTQEYLDYLDEVLKRIAESFKTGNFAKSDKCDSCYFKSVCGGKK